VGDDLRVPLDVAAMLNEALGSGDWIRRQVFGGTSHGAELWASASGQMAIVKRHPDAPPGQFEAVARRVRLLREAGVPAPPTTVVTDGADVMLVHDYLPGRSDPALTSPLVEHLIDIVGREAGLADESAEHWPELIRTSLTDGFAGYCEHGSLQTFSEGSQALLDRVRRVGRDPVVRRLPAPDLVHYDLHTGNVLSDDELRVSGLIDWDGVRAGDRVLDLANLTFTSTWKTADADVLARLWDAFLSSGTHDSRVVYMHHVVLRQVDWTIRHDVNPGPRRTIELASWALAVTEKGEFAPAPAAIG